jgi:hypothetical protein
MNEIDNIEDQSDLTTSNAEAVIKTDAPEVAETKIEEPKALSLDEALAKAFEKHTPAENDEKPKTALPKTAKVESTEQVTETKLVDPITGRVAEPMKAPAGWTPALREKWASVDPQVQKFIRDQEVGVSKKMQEVSDERKFAAEFKEVVAPYEAMLRGFNTTAKDHVKELMTMSHTLNTGTPQVKAQVLFNLINHFKPDAQTLQSLFAGQQPTPTAAPVNVQEEVQKVLSARDEAEQQKSIASDIEKFSTDPKNEFFSDVRDSMSRIITAGVVDAPTMPELFKKAYDLACSQHPEISQILAERTQVAAPVEVQTPAAVRSIKPSLGSGVKSKAPARKMSMDEAVHEAVRRAGLV